jgi:hypothetical protein
LRIYAFSVYESQQAITYSTFHIAFFHFNILISMISQKTSQQLASFDEENALFIKGPIICRKGTISDAPQENAFPSRPVPRRREELTTAELLNLILPDAPFVSVIGSELWTAPTIINVQVSVL